MVLAQRVPSLFTAAQILRGAPLSVLHFFSPLGAGGAGAVPWRVRAAYSRTRCLPQASAPTGRFCAARTCCSYHTFPRTSCLSALRAEVDSIYPARKSNALLCPCPEHFTEAKSGTVRAKNAPGGRVHLPSLPAFLHFCFWGENRSPPQLPTKGPTPRFTPSEVYGCHLPCRRATQALTKADTWFCVFGLRSSIQICGHWWRISR